MQMAIVYEDDEIRIYRDGVLYSQYGAENIDLLSSERYFVTFGLRHVGGGGSITGDIEDARIYGKALTVEQLRGLRPNRPSAIEPDVWWDFEGDQVEDRTGVFAVNHLDGNAELVDGKLRLGPGGRLVCTRPYVPETPEWPKAPPEDWPTYHLVHPGPGRAEPGDPNPAYDYKGRYHLHYIYANDYGFCYAHVSGNDMVHWKWHPTVLAPPFTGHGMFSGTGFFTKEGQPAMIYHGQGSGKNALTYALDDNLDRWTRPEYMEVFNEDGSASDFKRFWDPDCWLDGDTYYALSGGQNPPMMKSTDLKRWTFMGDLLHEDYQGEPGIPRDEDISCANMFKIGDKWMLLCISHRLGCRYFLGDFMDEKYLPRFHAKMNWINTDFEGKGPPRLVYFAPESMLTRDGRRVMWAWIIAKHLSPTGIQALPRELELPADGVLRINPLRELKTLRYHGRIQKNITVRGGSEYRLPRIPGDAVEMAVTLRSPLPESCGLKLLGDENNKNALRIETGSKRKTIRLGSIEPPFELQEGEDLTLRIFIDKRLVEVFVNDRQAAVVAHEYLRKDTRTRLFSRGAPLKVKSVKTWRLKSIWQ
jgi:sucrose-6-phosphate hydrolase SacC (GH32 family)